MSDNLQFIEIIFWCMIIYSGIGVVSGILCAILAEKKTHSLMRRGSFLMERLSEMRQSNTERHLLLIERDLLLRGRQLMQNLEKTALAICTIRDSIKELYVFDIRRLWFTCQYILCWLRSMSDGVREELFIRSMRSFSVRCEEVAVIELNEWIMVMTPGHVIIMFNTFKKYDLLPVELEGMDLKTRSGRELLRGYLVDEPSAINDLLVKNPRIIAKLNSAIASSEESQ